MANPYWYGSYSGDGSAGWVDLPHFTTTHTTNPRSDYAHGGGGGVEVAGGVASSRDAIFIK